MEAEPDNRPQLTEEIDGQEYVASKTDSLTSEGDDTKCDETKDSDGTSSQKSSSSETKTRKNKRKSQQPTKATAGALTIEMKKPKAHKSNSSDRPYVCDTCLKSFTRSHHLTRHEYSHTGERPFICGTCGKTFIRKHKLTVHIRSHTGEKPYLCSVCSKGFSSTEKRKLHERIHTGEKPYPCKSCEKCFKSSSQLKRHLETHRKREEFERTEEFGCTICYKVFVSEFHLSNHKAKHGKKKKTASPKETKSKVKQNKKSENPELESDVLEPPKNKVIKIESCEELSSCPVPVNQSKTLLSPISNVLNKTDSLLPHDTVIEDTFNIAKLDAKIVKSEDKIVTPDSNIVKTEKTRDIPKVKLIKVNNDDNKQWFLQDERHSINKQYTPTNYLSQANTMATSVPLDNSYILPYKHNTNSEGSGDSRGYVNPACMYSNGNAVGHMIETVAKPQNGNNSNSITFPSFARFGSLN